MKPLALASLATLTFLTPTLAQVPDTDLAAAFKTCQPHWITKTIVPPGQIRPIGTNEWETGWEQCQLIRDAYQKSAAASQEKEQAAKIEADRQRVLDLAKKL